MENIKIQNLIWNPIAETEKTLSETVGFIKRTKMVKTTFYSVAQEFFYKMANPIAVSKFDASMKDCEDTNWSNLYRIGADGKFVHEDMVMEWLKFIFGNDECLRTMGEIRGVDSRTIAKIIKWRNKMINGWKEVPAGDTKNECGIYFCPKKAHARIANIFAQHDIWFGHITTCIVNGDKTTNRACKCHIRRNLAQWKAGCHDNKKTYIPGTSKFVILMDGMGNRSLSIKEITWAIITGNNICYASYDQKTARVRTEWKDDKEAFILDFTLAKEGYSFNADSLIRHHAERDGRNTTSVIDEFTQYKTFMKIACSLDGECESVFTKSDYYDYVRTLSTIVREGRFVNASLYTDKMLGIANKIISDKSKSLKNISNEVSFTIETNKTPGTDIVSHENKNKSSGGGKGGKKNDKTPDDRQLIANIFHNIVSHPRTLMISVQGESKETPLIARWKSVRDGFVESYSYRYGKHVGELLDAIMELVSKDDVWNKMILSTASDYNDKVDLASLMFE